MNNQIKEIAENILTSFEFAGEWPSLGRVQEIALDESDLRISRDQASACLNLAMAAWEETKLQTKEQVHA